MMPAQGFVAAGMLLAAAGFVGLSLGRYREAQQRWRDHWFARTRLDIDETRAATEWRPRDPQSSNLSAWKSSHSHGAVQSQGGLERWVATHFFLATLALFIVAIALGMAIVELVVRLG